MGLEVVGYTTYWEARGSGQHNSSFEARDPAAIQATS